MGLVFVGKEFIEETRDKVLNGKGIWEQVRYELTRKAEDVMCKGPWSVTYHPSPVLSEDPHDYYSEAPYWWPDPKDSGGPFVRRDGERYPERFVKHHHSLAELSLTVLHLCNAGYYLKEKKYLDRAAELIRVWFLDEGTRMNPHVEYGEAIIGICSGRKSGIIALRQLDRIVHALGLLGENDGYGNEIDGMKEWLSQMMTWLTTSRIGREESKAGNNHMTWWNTHVAAYAAFTGNKEKLDWTFDYYRNVMIPKEMESDGSCPRELARTRSMHYSLFNLDAFTLLMEIAYQNGIDLWNYRLPDGRGIEMAIKFMMPFVDNPYLWRHQEIDGEIPDAQISFQYAVLRLGLEEGNRINLKRAADRSLIRDQDPLGPLVLLPGFPL